MIIFDGSNQDDEAGQTLNVISAIFRLLTAEI